MLAAGGAAEKRFCTKGLTAPLCPDCRDIEVLTADPKVARASVSPYRRGKNRVAFTAPPTSCRTGEQMVPTAIKSWRDRFEVRAFPFVGEGQPASLHWNT
jgi:hypothetical protein